MAVGVFDPVDLPCGLTVRNRLVKVALYEHLSTFLGGPPNKHHYSLYSTWARSNWGMIITGNVQVCPSHLSLGRDILVPKDITPETLKPFETLARSMHGHPSSPNGKPLAIIQLNHTGRQATTLIGGSYPWRPPLAPSSIRLLPPNQGWLSTLINYLAFQKPKAMTKDEIDEVVEMFARGAEVAWKSGFDGVEVHGAHGYLVAQFISPKTNRREDEYSLHDEASEGLRFLRRVVTAIRSRVPPSFALGIKINAADYTSQGSQESVSSPDARIRKHVQAIANWGGVDFIEVSGGDYESPEFMSTPTSIKFESPRQALFAQFSKAAMGVVAASTPPSTSTSPSHSHNPPHVHKPPLIMLTGGLRTPALIQGALTAGHAHLLGIGRGAVLNPDLPEVLRAHFMEGGSDKIDWNRERIDKKRNKREMRPEPALSTPSLMTYLPRIPLVGAGVSMAWYAVAMRRIAARGDVGQREGMGENEEEEEDLPYALGPLGAVLMMWLWVCWAGT